MLKELNVEDEIFLYDCVVKGDVIEYNLYESDENWTAVKTQEEVTQTLQLLNKRIIYDVTTAYDTLQNAQPESANWVDIESATNQTVALERVLKLKYRVKSCPFNFEWHLKKQDNSLTIQLPANQVSSLIEVLPTQIEELLDVLRRKEDEIKQYRTEYGNLRRSTLATKAFDVKKFREQYAATDLKVKSLQKIITRWRAEHVDAELELVENVEPLMCTNSSPKNIIKKEEPETSSPSTRKNVQESPRNRKRKALQAHKAQLTRTLQTRKLKLEYESESQSLSENEQPQDNKEVIEALTNVAADDANENEKDVEKRKVQKVSSKHTKDATNNVEKTATSPITKYTSEAAKEVARKSKKASPPFGVRPNTRQRRRECETPDSGSNDLMLIENQNDNIVYTVDDVTEPVGIAAVTSAISVGTNRNISNICSTPTLNICKVEQPRNDISSYVDSVLSQLDAFDKELKS